ncbi:hypothetical protein TM902_180027 [Tenacibaculum maritimum]|uniref:hypothetical protein n=1 Tax=Tenacibaculum maritimum TaxID=107401 RepID=UPI0012E5EFBC|nr:hypothetical protein [Tenacibaculum maritimum]MCD9582269.1 hypothetical protein [Tenacibaculum maritimum]MCD9636651.1 hypothetical protein [Tenacibaculum maritimum]CAA0144694.1 hypothetical protein TM902_180027 [Tenacibaculum maritimum]CAA0193952.1 hypothetical protein USCSE301_250057 [Tenacibaculum maritimum]
MNTEQATQEITTVNLQKNEPFYLPMIGGEILESVIFLDKATTYKISVVEDFKEITNGTTAINNDIISLNIETKCLVLLANVDTKVKLITIK